MKYRNIFTPGKIGALTVKNRVLMAPMSACLGNTDGTVSDALIAYLTARADGGVGMIVTEYCYVSQDGRSSEHQIGIKDDSFIPGLKRMTEAVHAHGAKICLQLQHGGRRSMEHAMAPTAIMKQAERTVPYEMTTEDCYRMVEDFISAAVRAKQAGFDMVEVHCSHGYLLNDFVSPSANRRTDEFGGGLSGRAKAPVDIIRGVKARCGADFPVSVRLNGSDMVSDGNLGRDAAALAMLFEDAGADLIDISGGMNGVGYGIAPAAVETGYNVDAALEIESAIDIPIAVAGRINEPEYAEMLLRKGHIDFITVGRALFADPAFVKKAAEGRETEIAPCVGCLQRCYSNYGHGGIYRGCMINPFAMRETMLEIRPAAVKKRVLVIGAGVAGLEAAWTAAACGHTVDVLEESAMPGGQFKQAAVPPHKQMLARAVTYYANMCEKHGVNIHYNTRADLPTIGAYRPDEVVIATGGIPLVPGIPGLKDSGFVINRDILSGKAVVDGEKVLILGGGLQGAETADFMNEHGYKVTVVEMKDAIAADDHPAVQRLLLQRLRVYDTTMIVSATVKAVYPDGVDYEQDGKLTHIDGFDAVVLAFGTRSNNALAESLKNSGYSLHIIGDASKAANALEAIYQGAKLGVSL